MAPNTPFVISPHPGPLVIPPYQLPHVTKQVQSQHHEQLRLHNECHHAKQALRNEVIAAIDDSYLAALKKHQTNTITTPLYEVLEYLFCNYGRVTPAHLVHDEQQLTNWSYDPTLPIGLVFNKVDDLIDLVHTAGLIYSAQQILNFAYLLLNKTGKFTHGIRDWNRLQQDQKTWDNFQTHFSTEHHTLRESCELDTRHSLFDTANIVQ